MEYIDNVTLIVAQSLCCCKLVNYYCTAQNSGGCTVGCCAILNDLHNLRQQQQLPEYSLQIIWPFIGIVGGTLKSLRFNLVPCRTRQKTENTDQIKGVKGKVSKGSPVLQAEDFSGTVPNLLLYCYCITLTS